jgi:preprotein translocase subunit SecA
MNKQRETIYSIRRSALEGKDQKDYVVSIAEDVADEMVQTFCPREQHPDQWNTAQFAAEVHSQFGIDTKTAGLDPHKLNHEELANALVAEVKKRYDEKEKLFGPQVMRWLERRVILDVVDTQWKDHLLTLDHLKEGIGLRGYGQKDPLVEFKKEAFTLFEDMMMRIDNETVRYLFHIRLAEGESPVLPSGDAPEDRPGSAAASPPVSAPAPPPLRAQPAALRELERRQRRQQQNLQYQAGPAQAEAPKPIRAGAKIGRNDPCPCGSGKKYKKCCGAAA